MGLGLLELLWLPLGPLIEACFLAEKLLRLDVDLLYGCNMVRLVLEKTGDLDSEVFDDAVDCAVSEHHLLVMAFDLVGISSLNES